ncbi:MAG TPA: nucleoside phosphorylase [Candidatus Dormibacteraeota bacterium]|jgi:uridine phosphorylase|nr:nucleoside phosphorylase [Candidatus Dormibacteraeota bacterium]
MPVDATGRQYHLQCAPGEVGGYVLLPGDPARCALIAERFSDARLVASNREFTTWSGTLDGVQVSACSTGIGGPSAAIACEELCNLGAHTLIRVGTCGGMQPAVRWGQLVVAQAAVRDEGTTAQYVPAGYPAVAHVVVVDALRAAAAARGGVVHHVGLVQTKDSFYGEMEPERMPVAVQLKSAWDAWIRAGVLASEMECATVFVVAAVRGVRAGAVLVCVNETPLTREMPPPSELPLGDLLDTGVDAVRRLIALDTAPQRP